MVKKWNHYACSMCGKTTIARYDTEGVTPFMLGCYVTKGCPGPAYSTFFRGPQGDDQKADVVFYRPATHEEAVKAVSMFPPESRDWLVNHYSQGGALIKMPDGKVADF